MDNPLMPQGQGPQPQGPIGQLQGPAPAPQLPGPSAPPDGQHPIVAAMSQAHDSAKAFFDQTKEHQEQLAATRRELQALTKLGDAITPDDVVEAAGGLVADGHASPTEMASYLTTMPPGGGEALQGWVQQHLTANQQATAQLAPAHELARHEMGTSALRMLLGQEAHEGGAGAFGPPGAVDPLTTQTNSPPAGAPSHG